MNNFMIRVLDILFALLGLILFFPLMLFITILLYFDFGSPIFIQSRVGVNGKIFKLIKFRTMSMDTESVSTHLINPSSVSKIGRKLRRIKLDELPQLINVLMGDMSFVGPRPCLPNQIEVINERNALGIFSYKPGITGLAQLKGVDMSVPKQLSILDAEMINDLNVLGYLKYIFQTAIGGGRGDHVRD